MLESLAKSEHDWVVHSNFLTKGNKQPNVCLKKNRSISIILYFKPCFIKSKTLSALYFEVDWTHLQKKRIFKAIHNHPKSCIATLPSSIW